MRLMVIVKTTKNSEAGVLPDEKLVTAMGTNNGELVKDGVMLAGEGLFPPSRGKRVEVDEKIEAAAGRNIRSSACGMFLERVLLIILVVGAILASAPRVDAQPSVFPLRVEWTAGPTDGRWQHLCGNLYNETPRATSEVQLLVEGRDTSGQVTDSRRASVLGYIAPWGRTSFCSTAAAGAARYSVTIIGVQWAGGER